MRKNILSACRGRGLKKRCIDGKQLSNLEHGPKRAQAGQIPSQKIRSGEQNKKAARGRKARGPRRSIKYSRVPPKALLLFVKRRRAILTRKAKNERDWNKENMLRKTSDDYFRKLTEERAVVKHSHGRKVSWKEELDDVCLFYKHEAPTDIVYS